MITTKKQGNKSLAEAITEVLDSGILKNENYFENILNCFNMSWKLGDRIEVLVDTYNSKLLFRIKGDYRTNYKDIDLIGDYIKIGELNLKLLSRNQFFADSVDKNKWGSAYYRNELTKEKVKEYLDSQLLRKKLLSLADKFLKEKLITKQSIYPLLDLYQFKIRKEEATIEQKIFALYKIKILHEPVLSYFDLSNQEFEFNTVKNNIIKDLSSIDSSDINDTTSDFSLWFDKNVLKNTDDTLTSLFKLTIQAIKKDNINNNNRYKLPKSKYISSSREITHLSANWRKLRDSTRNKELENNNLSRGIKKELLQLLSYKSISDLYDYDLPLVELFEFFREDFIFNLQFYKELAYLKTDNPYLNRKNIEDFYIDEFIMKGTIGSDKTVTLYTIPDKVKNLYVSKPVYDKFINVIQALDYNKEDFISPNTTLHFLEDFENIDEIKERFV